MGKYDCIKLENQLCFPLYVVSKEIVKRYKPFLDKLDLTYTQYIVMMAMWEHNELTVKELGKCLYLDSGTLTPVLKTLEKKGLVERSRSKEDERVLNVYLTEQGNQLKEEAVNIPEKMSACMKLDKDDAMKLGELINKLLSKI